MMNIETIRLGDANGYPITTDQGRVLIDTGDPTTRATLVEALANAGCHPGDLSLFILTHATSITPAPLRTCEARTACP